jgi:hypothetical protein
MGHQFTALLQRRSRRGWQETEGAAMTALAFLAGVAFAIFALLFWYRSKP